MKASFLLLGLAAVLTPRADAQAWNHAHNGDDWEGIGECGHMERQSPIDISEDFAAPIDDRLVVNWEVSESAALTFTNLGDTYKIDFSGTAGQRGTLQWKGYTYDLLQVHCHAASEHTWEGAGRDVECHFVHKVKDQKMFAVTGVTFAASHLISGEVQESAFLKAMIEAAANAPGTTANNKVTTISFPLAAGLNVSPVDDVSDGSILSDPPVIFRMARPVPIDVAGRSDTADVRVQQALSSWREFFHYRGSLTTPPCTQAVMWFVQRRAILVPRSQAKAAFDLFQKPYTLDDGTSVIKGNFRETQNEQNSQELYKVRMDWTAARADPVVSNQQVADAHNALVMEQCRGVTGVKKVEDWKIIISVIIPTFSLVAIISTLFFLARLRSAKSNDTKKADHTTPRKKVSDPSPVSHASQSAEPSPVVRTVHVTPRAIDTPSPAHADASPSLPMASPRVLVLDVPMDTPMNRPADRATPTSNADATPTAEAPVVAVTVAPEHAQQPEPSEHSADEPYSPAMNRSVQLAVAYTVAELPDDILLADHYAPGAVEEPEERS